MVGCVSLIVVMYMLSNADFGLDDDLEDASRFTSRKDSLVLTSYVTSPAK